MIALGRAETLAQAPRILSAPVAALQKVQLSDLGARHAPRKVDEEVPRPPQLGIRSKTARHLIENLTGDHRLQAWLCEIALALLLGQGRATAKSILYEAAGYADRIRLLGKLLDEDES